jgi:hypothetical protein
MENKFKSLAIFEFQECFPDDEACYKYFFDLKWGNGFVYPHCVNTKYSKSRSKYDMQYARYHRPSSPTSQTLFHQLKIPVLKAFYIVYHLSNSKKGLL